MLTFSVGVSVTQAKLINHLVLALLGHFQLFKLHVWLRITDEDSAPEMHIWSISLI